MSDTIRPLVELRKWTEVYRNDFAEMHADPVVMADQGGPLDRAASDEKFDRYREAWTMNGISRWAIADLEGRFLGYAGVMKRSDLSHPLGEHLEIGWRLRRDAWGKGYATEAAKAALLDAFGRFSFAEVLSYTSSDNLRSQAMMKRLGLRRNPLRDFSHDYGRMVWRGLVWVAYPGSV